MKKIYIILMLCCGLGMSCTPTELSFPHEETLRPELMPLQGITNPLRVDMKPPFLVVQNNMNDSIFRIYDLYTYELKSAFGKKGEGPEEFVLPWMAQTKLSDILIADQHSFHRFGINKEGQPMLKETKEPRYIDRIDDAAFLNDSLFVVDAQYTAPNLYLLNFQDELPKEKWQYRDPNMIDYYADPNMGNVYANDERIVFCYGYKKQIDFMKTDFKLIRRVEFKYDIPTDAINSENQGDYKMSYVDAYLGKRYLYALFLGTSWNENRKNETFGAFLEVFDLDGNPISKYRLYGRRPVYFAVDESTFTLYGTGEDGNPESNLLVYKLKGLS